jgi:hypothetical protein
MLFGSKAQEDKKASSKDLMPPPVAQTKVVNEAKKPQPGKLLF